PRGSRTGAPPRARGGAPLALLRPGLAGYAADGGRVRPYRRHRDLRRAARIGPVRRGRPARPGRRDRHSARPGPGLRPRPGHRRALPGLNTPFTPPASAGPPRVAMIARIRPPGRATARP